jgi:hypothetical protein
MADDIFDDFDKESQKFLQGVKFLSFDEINSGKVGNQNPFEGLRTNKSFEEISYEKKYGLTEKCKETENDFYRGSVDINMLVAELRMNKTNNNYFFHYKNLVLSTDDSIGISPTTMAPVYSNSTSHQSNPFIYRDLETNTEKVAQLRVSLNKRACYV